MYVDQNACIVLMLASGVRKDGSEYVVHGSFPNCQDEWSAHCTLNATTLCLQSPQATKEGHVGEGGTVAWNDGGVWTPLHMSALQFAFLTRRPYVPVTYVFLMVVRSAILNVKDALRRVYTSRFVAQDDEVSAMHGADKEI